MQFDRDRHTLQSFFTEICGSSLVRDQFTRIRQISCILGVKKMDEIYGFMDSFVNTNETTNIHGIGINLNTNNNNNNVQNLTTDEIKKILSLRTDFSPNSIQQLKL